MSVMQLYDFEGGKIWLDPDASTMQALMVKTQWEWRKVEYMQRHLKAGMAFADVGAFNGYFTLIAAKLVGETGRVDAFEPDMDCVGWLQRNLKANDLLHQPQRRVTQWIAAVGARKEVIRLYKNEQLGWSSYVRATSEMYERNCVRLGQVLLTGVDMVKIDVEGMELDVLRGMEYIATRGNGLHIMLDLHPELGVHPGGIEDFLLSHDFKLFDIRSDFAPIERIPDSLVELLAVK